MPPTLKDTPRYAFVPDATRKTYQQVSSMYENLFGMVGLAQARLVLVSEESGGIIIRVAHDRLDELRCAVVAIDVPTGIARVSGTLARLRENLVSGSR